MWAQAQFLPSRWAGHLSVVLVTILFAEAAVVSPLGKDNETNSAPEESKVGYPGVNSVSPGPLAQCNNYYADIVFVVDSTSIYMNDDNWKKVKKFLAEVSIVLGAGLDDRIRLGMVVYGEDFSQVFSLNNFTKSSEISQAIINAERHSNDTTADVKQVLHGLHADLFTYDNGARMFLPHQAVIFTTPIQKKDSNEEDIIKEIAMVHDAGIETYSIAVEAEANFEDLAKLLASPPRKAEKNYWYLRHYGNLDMSLATNLASELCTFNRDTSITFSRSYAPTNDNQNIDDDETFRAAEPNDEDYDRRQQKNFGGPPVIRNDDFSNQRDDREERQHQNPPRQERPPPPPPRQERPPPQRQQRGRPNRPRGGSRRRGPGPRIGSSYQGPPPRKDGGGNGPPPPGGHGPGGGGGGGGGPGQGQNIRIGGVGPSGGRAPQTHGGYVPRGGYAFGGHDGFRGPNRTPQGVKLRGEGFGYGGHDGFVGYGPHSFRYGSAGVRGPVFGPRAPVFRSTKTRNPAPSNPRPRRPPPEDSRERRPPPEDSRERRPPPEDSRERRPPPEDSRENFDDNNSNEQKFRPPPHQQQFRRPPPRDDREDFRSAPRRQENNFRPPPPRNNFRPPPRDNNNFNDRSQRPQDGFKPPPPHNNRNFNDDSQQQPNFHNNRPPPNQFQNNRPPPPLPRGRFQDNRPQRPPPNFRGQHNNQQDNNRARDESPQEDDHSPNPGRQAPFHPPPPPVSYVRPIMGFNSPINPHNTLNRHPNDAGYQQAPPQQGRRLDNDRFNDDGAGDGRNGGPYNVNQGNNFQQPPPSQQRPVHQGQEPGPQYTQPGQVGQAPPVHQSFDERHKEEYQKTKAYQKRDKYDNTREEHGAEHPQKKLRYSESHDEKNYETFKGFNKYYGYEDRVKERGDDVARFIAGADGYNNDHGDQLRGDNRRNYDVPSQDYRSADEAPKEGKKSTEEESSGQKNSNVENRPRESESEGVKEFVGKVRTPYNQGYKEASKDNGETKQYAPEYRPPRPSIEAVGQPVFIYGPRGQGYPPPPPQGAYPQPQGAYPQPQGAYPQPQGAYPPPPGAFPPPGGQRLPEGRRPEGNVYGSREVGEQQRQPFFGNREGETNARRGPVYGSREAGVNRPNQQNIYGSREVGEGRRDVERRRQSEGSEPRRPFNPYTEGQQLGRRPYYPYPPYSGDPRRPVEVYRYVPIVGRPPASYETLRNQPNYYGNPEFIQGRLASPGVPVFRVQNRQRDERYKNLDVDHIAKDITRSEIITKDRKQPEEPKIDRVPEQPKPNTEQFEKPRAARLSAAVLSEDNLDSSAAGVTGSTVTIATIAGVLGTVFLCAVIALTTRSIRKRQKRKDEEKMATLNRNNCFIPPNHLPFNTLSSKFSSTDLDNDDDTISTISSCYSVVSGHSKSA